MNAIAPGPMLAPDDLSAEQLKAVEDATPLGRWGGAGEIAKIVLALIDSDFMTGETIRVDGGRHLSLRRQASQVVIASFIDSSAPVSSARSRAKQNRT